MIWRLRDCLSPSDFLQRLPLSQEETRVLHIFEADVFIVTTQNSHNYQYLVVHRDAQGGAANCRHGGHSFATWRLCYILISDSDMVTFFEPQRSWQVACADCDGLRDYSNDQAWMWTALLEDQDWAQKGRTRRTLCNCSNCISNGKELLTHLH